MIPLNSLVFDYKPEENPDWGFARNRFAVLKRPQGTWSSSVFSVSLGEFVTPNRDYPYQGLMTLVDHEYWKFLDALPFSLKCDGKHINLEPGKVRVWPWKVLYRYYSDQCVLEVEYYLLRNDWKNQLGMWVNFKLEPKVHKKFELSVSPLIDIRFMYDQSSDDYKVERGENLLISKGNKAIVIGPLEQMEEYREKISWNYKLGSGFRKDTDEGVLFQSETRDPVRINTLKYDLKKEVKIGIVCGKKEGIEDKFDHLLLNEHNEEEEKKWLKKVLRHYKIDTGDKKLDKYLTARLVTLVDKFGIYENSIKVPEAGEWWYKTVWFRDLFEGILNNMNFYMKFKEGEKWLKHLFSWTALFLRNGRIPNRILEKKNTEPDYNSLDSTFLYLLSLGKFAREVDDQSFKNKAKNIFSKAMKDLFKLTDSRGFIYCKPWETWTDSFKIVSGKKISSRIPDKWVNEIPNVERKSFLLPEINALWIRVLLEYEKLTGNPSTVFDKALKNYKKVFWNEKEGFIYNLVREEKKDNTKTSLGVVALSLLPEIFTHKDFERAYSVLEKELLVKRKPFFIGNKELPFGLLVKNTSKRIYLGDEEYHEATVWPRDTPYLIRFLKLMGKDGEVKKLLLNVLDHQMSEGAIFYTQELFSLPDGKNPHKEGSNNLVPVKNPVQYWSQFVEPFYIE